MKNTTKETTMKDVNKMTLKEFAAAIRAGKIEVKPEFSHNPTADEVTMNGRYGCEQGLTMDNDVLYTIVLCVITVLGMFFFEGQSYGNV